MRNFATMEATEAQQIIIEKLNNGGQFGLYEGGTSCYFDDGTKVHYRDLWAALRIIHNLDTNHHKTLSELCPGFKGTFSNKFSGQKLVRRMFPFLFS